MGLILSCISALFPVLPNVDKSVLELLLKKVYECRKRAFNTGLVGVGFWHSVILSVGYPTKACRYIAKMARREIDAISLSYPSADVDLGLTKT